MLAGASVLTMRHYASGAFKALDGIPRQGEASADYPLPPLPLLFLFGVHVRYPPALVSLLDACDAAAALRLCMPGYGILVTCLLTA